MSACLLALFFALTLVSCSSDPDESNVQPSPRGDDNVLTAKQSVDDSAAAMIVEADDNRSKLEPCGLKVEGIAATSVTVTWSEPTNSSSKPFYRLEVAEDKDFTKGHMSFPKLTETLYQISDLKINAQHYFKLQAYLGPDDDTHAPSYPEFAQAITLQNALLDSTNLQLTIDYGKFSAKWDPPANASGDLEYIANLSTDESFTRSFDSRLVKEPMIKDWIVTPAQDYWLQIQARGDLDSSNDRDRPSSFLVKHFYVPGNQLKTPGNLKITPIEDLIQVYFDPIDNNKDNFEYLLNVYLDEARNRSFGEFRSSEHNQSLSGGVKQNSQYWFDLQAVPVTGNYVDTPSETISSFVELPSITYENPRISKLELEPIDDPETPGTLVLLSWDKTVNGDGRHKYWLEIADDEDFAGGLQEFEAPADAVRGDYGPLLPGRTYYLRMRVNAPTEDATRNSSEWSEIRTIVTPPAQPVPPATPNE